MHSAFDNAKQRTSAPWRNDIVGSFLRPATLKDARTQFQTGEITPEELRHIEDQEITKLVQKQKEIGLKGVTDGEFRRSWWHLDFFWGLEGVEKKTLEKGFMFKGGQARGETAILKGKLGNKKSHPQVEHFKFLKNVAGDDVVCKQNIPAPAQFLFELQRPDNKENTQAVYPNFGELLGDIATAYHNVILAFYEAGCRNLQIDDCTWGLLCDPKIREMKLKDGADFEKILRTNAELNNRALEGLPKDLVINMHVCRGNFKSDFIASGGYDPVCEVLLRSMNVTGFYLEFDTERAGGFEILKCLGQDKQVVIGIFTSKFGELEDREKILARIEEATKYVDINQINISTQCGFASTEEGNILTEDEQWNKLKFIKEIADSIWH